MLRALLYFSTLVVLIQGSTLSNIDDARVQKVKDIIEKLTGLAAVKLNEELSQKIDVRVNHGLEGIKSLDSSCSAPAYSQLELIRTSFKKQLNECSTFMPEISRDAYKTWDDMKQDLLWALNIPTFAGYQFSQCFSSSYNVNIFFCVGEAILSLIPYTAMDALMIIEFFLEPLNLAYQILVKGYRCVDQDVLMAAITDTVSNAHYCHKSLPTQI